MNTMIIDNIETMHNIVENINIGVTILDEQNRVLFWNSFMARHSGIPSSDLVGKNIFETFSYLPMQWMELKLRSVRLIKNYSFVSWTQKPYLFRFSHSSMMKGESIEFMHQNCTFIPIKNPATGEIYVCITIQDMTDVVISHMKLKEINDINKTLELMTNHDNLTSLYNRVYVEKQIDFEFNKAKRYGNIFSVIFFDIDRFKDVNDTHGHLAGDEVLKNLAEKIKSQLRSSDIMGRYGGEEFILLLPETNLENASSLSQRLRISIEKMVTSYHDIKIMVTISLGVVQFRPDIKNYLQMIHEADIALYHSKKNGRNAVTQYKLTGCRLMNCSLPG
ncbi:MAG: diguanylate cyclase [Desulfamplus sp.]|nr:diguanylate cyclase [Desulfamplus sp.]